MVFIGVSFNYMIDRALSWANKFKGLGYGAYCAIKSYLGYGGDYDCFQSFSSSDWSKKDLIFFMGHGTSDKTGIESRDIPLLSNSVMLSESCNTCSTYDDNSFCNHAIRQGALAYIGAVSTTFTGNSIYKDTMNGIYYDDSAIGKAFNNNYISNRYWYMITLFGDPTLQLNPPYLLSDYLK